MSGHSKWHNIKNTKGAADAKRSATFSKISKDIIVSVQIGGSGDPGFNPMLRLSISKAKAANMPNDKIDKAINRGLGNVGTDEIFEDKTYEAYGPGGAAMLIDCHTDNANRTLADIKTIITRNGGKVLSEGAISWQFKETGRIILSTEISEESVLDDKIILPLMEIDGVEDVMSINEKINIQVLTNKQNLKNVHSEIQSLLSDLVKIEEANIVKMSSTNVKLSDDDHQKLEELVEKIEEVQDVENVFTNAD